MSTASASEVVRLGGSSTYSPVSPLTKSAPLPASAATRGTWQAPHYRSASSRRRDAFTLSTEGLALVNPQLKSLQQVSVHACVMNAGAWHAHISNRPAQRVCTLMLGKLADVGGDLSAWSQKLL